MKAKLKVNMKQFEMQWDKGLIERQRAYLTEINACVNTLMNLNSLIEIKTCQILIKTGQIKYPTRLGRFILDLETHQFLIKNNGFYMFIVKNDSYIHGLRLILAKEIPYQKFWQWDKIIIRG